MAEMDFWRQLGILVPSEDLIFPVTVIGCGGIGSPTVLALAKMGCADITIYDDDLVEVHNLPNQLHKMDHVGQPKVDGFSKVVEEFTGFKPKAVVERVSSSHPLEGVVISGVDSMKARQEIWQAVKYNPLVKLYIDARMGAEVCRIYSVQPVDPTDVRRYESSLYSDEEALDAPCTERSIIYNVFVIAGLIGNQVKKFAKGEALEKEIIFDLVTLTLLTL
jgi:threonine dehydrogenase-like Zn-dependent dehydrogenase